MRVGQAKEKFCPTHIPPTPQMLLKELVHHFYVLGVKCRPTS